MRFGCMADRQQNIVEIKAHKKWTGKKCVDHQPIFKVSIVDSTFDLDWVDALFLVSHPFRENYDAVVSLSLGSPSAWIEDRATG